MVSGYVPGRGDIGWLQCDPQAKIRALIGLIGL